MSDWIECGLPWTFYGDWKNAPQPPNLKKELKKEFGTTQEKEYKKLTDILGGAKYGTHEYETITKSKEYKAAQRAYKKISGHMQVWSKVHPAWIAYMEAIQAYDVDQKQKSFCGKQLNTPGTMVEILDNKVLKQYLIGNINILGGVCDDCMGFSGDAVVVRYKVSHEC